MADDQHVVPGHREVELERRDADRERERKTLERVLGRKAARAAMALQVEGLRRGRRNAEQQDEEPVRPHAASIAQPRNNPVTPCAKIAAEIRNISA